MDLVKVQRELQVQKILKENGLDFIIEKRSLVDQTDVIMNPNDDSLIPTKTPYYALKNMTTNKYLYNCTSGYQVSQTKDLVDLVLQGTRNFGNVSVEKGGAINGGKKTFLQLKIDGHSTVGNDTLTKYITILDSNDGSAGISFGIGDVTVSCMNQFFKFYKEGFTKIMHSSSMEQKLEKIPEIITMIMNESFKRIELYQEFESTFITKDLAHRMVETIVGIDRRLSKEELKEFSSRKINTMNSLYKHIDKEINTKGLNLWGLHSGVTSFTTHKKSVPKRKNGRIESLMIGSGYKDNQNSIKFCIDALNQ